MVKHIIIWKLKDEFSDTEKEEAKKKVKEGLEGLAGQIPGLTEIKVNINGLPSSTGDMMLDSTFETEDDLKAYQTNPKHVAVATYVRSVVASRSCLDFEI